MLTALLPDLTSTCAAQIEQLLNDFEAAPSRTCFLDLGAVAEILVLSEAVPEMKAMVQPVRDAAARWLKSGLLEDICFVRVESVYHTALLLYLAQRGEGFSPGHMRVMTRLREGRLIGRSEMPVLSQSLIAAYFSRCGMGSEFGELGRRDLAKMIDKRVLRARTDEYDTLVVIMCAQLLHLEPDAGHRVPSLYPSVLLVHAMRGGDSNRVAVLAFLCARWFGLPSYLRESVRAAIMAALPKRTALLPLPHGLDCDSAYIERAGRGLRIRSTIALLSSLHTLGEQYANARTCLAVA